MRIGGDAFVGRRWVGLALLLSACGGGRPPGVSAGKAEQLRTIDLAGKSLERGGECDVLRIATILALAVDEDVQLAALQTVAAHGSGMRDVGGTGRLREVVADIMRRRHPRTYGTALRALVSASESEAAVSVIRSELSSGDSASREMVASVIEEMGPAAAGTEGALLLVVRADGGFAPAAKAALVGMRLGASESIVGALADSSPAVRELAVAVLGHPDSGDASGAVAKVAVLATEDPESAVRAEAVRTLAALRSDDPIAVKALGKALSDSSDEVHGLAVRALYYLGESAEVALDELIASVMSERSIVSLEMLAIANLGEKGRRAVPALRRRMKEEDWQAERAARALVAVDGSVEAELIDRLHSHDATVRARVIAVRGLAAARTQWAAEALRAVISSRDSDTVLRRAAVEALGEQAGSVVYALSCLEEACGAVDIGSSVRTACEEEIAKARVRLRAQ